MSAAREAEAIARRIVDTEDSYSYDEGEVLARDYLRLTTALAAVEALFDGFTDGLIPLSKVRAALRGESRGE